MMNRHLCFLAVFSFAISEMFSQDDSTAVDPNPLTEKWDNTWVKINTGAFKIGASLGFNYILQDVFVPALSPVDNSLIMQPVNPLSYLLSTNIVVNPFGSPNKELSSRRVKRNMQMFFRGISLVASVNLAQLGAQPNSFNTRIDGGLGLGYRLSNDFHLGLTAEMIAVRQLRDYYVKNFAGKPILINEEPLNALDLSDNRLFTDMYVLGISFKFIYILVGAE